MVNGGATIITIISDVNLYNLRGNLWATNIFSTQLRRFIKTFRIGF